MGKSDRESSLVTEAGTEVGTGRRVTVGRRDPPADPLAEAGCGLGKGALTEGRGSKVDSILGVMLISWGSSMGRVESTGADIFAGVGDV